MKLDGKAEAKLKKESAEGFDPCACLEDLLTGFLQLARLLPLALILPLAWTVTCYRTLACGMGGGNGGPVHGLCGFGSLPYRSPGPGGGGSLRLGRVERYTVWNRLRKGLGEGVVERWVTLEKRAGIVGELRFLELHEPLEQGVAVPVLASDLAEDCITVPYEVAEVAPYCGPKDEVIQVAQSSGQVVQCTGHMEEELAVGVFLVWIIAPYSVLESQSSGSTICPAGSAVPSMYLVQYLFQGK